LLKTLYLGMNRYQYITYDKNILGGKPIIKGTRISVELILEWLASGSSINQIIESYPQLKKEAVQEALIYAADLAKNEILIESERH
jgi:uncharacterized protein (DUF433 family)